MKFQVGDRVIYRATPEYRITGLTHFEGVKGIVVSAPNVNDCYHVLFDGQDKTWQPCGVNLHLVYSYEVKWEV